MIMLKLNSFLLVHGVLVAVSISAQKANNVLYEYAASPHLSATDILRATLTSHDFINDVKMLPDKREVILRVSYRRELRLLYALNKVGPITLSISPCSGNLEWDLMWRPYTGYDLGVTKTFNKDLKNNTTTQRDLSFDSSIESTKKSTSSNKRKKLRKKRGSFGFVQVIERNFSSPMIQNPRIKHFYKNQLPFKEVHLNHVEGGDPWLFQKENAEPGLYVIEIRSFSNESKIHAVASKVHISDTFRQREIQSFKAKDSIRKHSVVLSWSSRRSYHDKLFCLAVSRIRFYSSLCEARELQKTSKDLPPSLVDESLILGCTPESSYNLPVAENNKYFLSLWQRGTLIPIVQAVIKARPHRKVRRLKPGAMAYYTMPGTGHVNVKYNVKKIGKKLHVGVVSCYGGVKVVVSDGKNRVAAAQGREVLYLSIHNVPKAKLTIKVSPQSPIQSHYRVQIVATHSARKLPMPRLPKNSEVKVFPLDCSSAEILWNKAPGGATYCIVLQRHPSGRPPEIRSPLQCGWESIIKRTEYFDRIECMDGNKKRRKQTQVLTDLPSGKSFLINVLVRHPKSGMTLTLFPAMLNLPNCIENNSMENYLPGANFSYDSSLQNEIMRRL